MQNHRNPRARLPKRPTPDNGAPAPAEGPCTPPFNIAAAIDILREIGRRTESMICAAEDLLEKDPWGDDDEDDERRAEHLADLVAAAKEAARAAVLAGDQIATGLAMHRAVTP
jgi:hypothetical protein